MKKLGVWLDKEKAHIVTIKDENEILTKVNSQVEDYHVHGGSGTRFKGGPQDVVQDSKYLEREKHQLKAYFKDIIAKIEKADKIVLFGPADTNEKLYKELMQHYKDLSSKVMAVKKADSMTDNQMKAFVRDFYKE